METTKYIRLVFLTDRGKLTSIRIDSPKNDLAGVEVADVMDSVINNGIFAPLAGKLVTKHSALVITTTQSEFDFEDIG